MNPTIDELPDIITFNVLISLFVSIMVGAVVVLVKGKADELLNATADKPRVRVVFVGADEALLIVTPAVVPVNVPPKFNVVSAFELTIVTPAFLTVTVVNVFTRVGLNAFASEIVTAPGKLPFCPA